MIRAVFFVLIGGLSLSLSGCCTRQKVDEFSRFEGTAGQPSEFCGIFSGFGTTDEPERFTAAYSPVGVIEYGNVLCGSLPAQKYASCINQLWTYYRDWQRRPPEPGESTSGPFGVLVWDQVLLGSYWSDPFRAYFQVTHEGTGLSCRGSYDALQGDTQAKFDVRCDNGKHGWADIVLDRSGRNGIGRVYMDDGTVGHVVFGYATMGGALELADRP